MTITQEERMSDMRRQRVAGVAMVTVSYKDKTAIVTYDDSKADVTALTAATTDAGYPSAPKR
jgi:periplasmic mercuric ion binding protein